MEENTVLKTSKNKLDTWFSMRNTLCSPTGLEFQPNRHISTMHLTTVTLRPSPGLLGYCTHVTYTHTNTHK